MANELDLLPQALNPRYQGLGLSPSQLPADAFLTQPVAGGGGAGSLASPNLNVSAGTGVAGVAALLAGLNPLGLGLNAISLISGLVQGGKARRSAKEAQEKQRLQESFTNLVRAAGGRGPGAPSIQQAIPPVDVAGAFGAAGSLVNQAASTRQESSELQQLRDFRDRQQKERERHNVATEGTQKLIADARKAAAGASGRKGQLSDQQLLQWLLGFKDMFGIVTPAVKEGPQKDLLVDLARSRGVVPSAPQGTAAGDWPSFLADPR